MKRCIGYFVCLCLAILLSGCIARNLGPVELQPAKGTEREESTVELTYTPQYIRTNGYQDGAKFPKVQIIGGLQDLKDYYTANHQIYDLERKETVYADTTVGFLDACDSYDEAFFEKNYLIFVLLEEGSGSVRHRVTAIEQTADKKIHISINRKVPEVGTSDMAQWHIMLELRRDAIVETADDVLVYLDGKLTFDGTVVEPIKPAEFQTPPKGMLRTPEGDVPLTAAGFDWTYENGDGTQTSIIADQAARPAPEDSLQPVILDRKYAETVYAPVPGTTDYSPTNSLGYLLKLDFEGTNPTSIQFTCWPDAVWQDNTVQEVKVVSHQEGVFYARPGSYIYEITVKWNTSHYHGSANYYVYITDEEEPHTHMTALHPQTVAEPVIGGYCGNIQTTLYIGDQEYTFMYGNSVTLTDMLASLDYDPDKVCRCMPQYRADTEFGNNYHIHLDYGFVRCEKGQADLTKEQVDTIAEIIRWVETTEGQYLVGS